MARPNDIVGHFIDDRLTCTTCSHKLGLETTDREITRWDIDTSDLCDVCRGPMHPLSSVYVIGSNMPGYLPDSEPFTIVGTFEDAREALIGELDHALTYAANDEEETEIREAIEDVECWSGPDSVRVGMYIHWISVQ